MSQGTGREQSDHARGIYAVTFAWTTNEHCQSRSACARQTQSTCARLSLTRTFNVSGNGKECMRVHSLAGSVRLVRVAATITHENV